MPSIKRKKPAPQGPRKFRVMVYPKQAAFLASTERYRAFCGGRGCIAAETIVNGIPVAEMTRSGMVPTLLGTLPAQSSFRKGRADLFRVTTQSGKVVVVTDAHRFLTPLGWSPLARLQVGSLVAVDGSADGADWKETRLSCQDDYRSRLHCDDGLQHPLEVFLQDTTRQWPWPNDFARGLASSHLSIADFPGPGVHNFLAAYDLFHAASFASELLQDQHRIHAQAQPYLHRCCTPPQSCPSEEHGLPSGLPCPCECLDGETFWKDSLDESRISRLFRSGFCNHTSESAWIPSQTSWPSSATLFAEKLPGLLQESVAEDIFSYPHDNARWDAIQDIQFVRKGDFYDFHVPVANHYLAQGIYHHNSGKSFIGAYDLLLKASEKKNRLYLVVAPNFPVLRDSSLRTFLALARATGLLADFNKTEHRCYLRSGSEVVFKSAENPDSLRGPNISGLWFDEAQGTSQNAFTVAIGCLREDPFYNWCTATFTPKGRLHWTYPTFAKKDKDGHFRPNTTFIHAKTSENPFLPLDFEHDLRNQYTTNTALQELEGEFLDAGGIMFKREWFSNQIINFAPRELRRVRYWDKAATKGGGCYTAGSLLGGDDDNLFYLENIIRGQWSTLQRDDIIALTAQLDTERYGPGAVRIFVEEEGGSGGKDSSSYTTRRLAGHIVGTDRVSGSKRVRAEPFASQCEAGNVFLVSDDEMPWISDFVDEAVQFPEGHYSDQIDSCSGGFNKLTHGVYAHPVAGGGKLPGGSSSNGVGASTNGAPNTTGLRDFKPR